MYSRQCSVLLLHQAESVRRFLESKNTYDTQNLFRLFKALNHVILVTDSDPETQSRWVSSATEVLSACGEEMRLAGHSLDWRVFWNLFHRKYEEVRTACNDGDAAFKCYVEVHTLCKKVLFFRSFRHITC